MNPKIRWGIIGCGIIAPKFFHALENTGEGQVVAAASKSWHRAQRLQKKLGIPQAYGSYEEMLHREQLDAVYIANTHAEHAAAAKLCLNHGLPVLVEKAFTRNAKEAAELIALARQKKLFLMEAMWTRFNPSSAQVRALIAEGAIGEVQHLRAAFCVKMNPLSLKMAPWNRMYSPRLAGGALLDIGVYPIAYARMIFGRPPAQITGSAKMAWTGVDKTSEYHFEYSGGRRAELISSFVEHRPREAIITGTHGIISVPHFSGASSLCITRSGYSPETIECAAPGFEYEIREVHRCLREGLTESPAMPLGETLETMRTMDALRAQWGMKYPGE
ncbi:MAG: Gfo/Idh/MocA family oxidoreductase [Kiritimatiellales bacterium]|jgi:predicted dehydrogenase